MISPTFKNTVTGFKIDSKDNVLFMESNSNGQSYIKCYSKW